MGPVDDQLRALLQVAGVDEPTAKKLADAGWKDMPRFAAAATSPEDFAAWAAELGLDRLSRASLLLAWEDARSKSRAKLKRDADAMFGGTWIQVIC